MSTKVITKAILVLAAIGGVISGCATKSEFKDLKNRMDALESDKIQSIEGQISSIDTSLGLLDQTDDQLEEYINALKQQVLELEVTEGEEREALEASIKALQAEDESLHKQMEELKAYVDTKLNGVKDWASATFVTLEEYNKTVDVITGIQAKVDSLHSDIAKEYEATINEAIEKTAKSMESWVNEQLTGYYDIATMNTKLDSLKSALEKQIKEQNGEMKEQIAQNTEDIEALESELEKTAEDITDAYKEAIEDAIEENNGTITQIIQKAIDGVNTKIKGLDERVTELETAVKKLEERMDEAERTLKNLASITYIPKYSDGIERVEYSIDGESVEVKDLTLRFDVYPAGCADSIVTAYGKNNSIISARAVYTQTKATAGEFVDLKISNIIAETDGNDVSTGALAVTVSPDNLGDEFFTGSLEAAVVVRITTDYSNIQSGYIRLAPMQVTPYITFSSASPQGFKMTLPTDTEAAAKFIDCFEYSTDNGKNWTKVTATMDDVTFGNGTDLLLRGKSQYGTAFPTAAGWAKVESFCNIYFNNTVNVTCSGDIRTLIDWENYSTVSTADARFAYLFANRSSLTSAPKLPSTELASDCYRCMFTGTALKTAPALPAITLADHCYYEMFSGCTALETAPEILAETLASYSCGWMFERCTALETAPALPAETLASYCYNNMFNGCTTLENAPVLPAKTLAEGCYSNMFEGCTALETASELSAETLASFCYAYMFNGCSKFQEVTVKAGTTVDFAFNYWLNGVAASGKIHKRSTLELSADSVSGIPSGWTAENDVTDYRNGSASRYFSERNSRGVGE